MYVQRGLPAASPLYTEESGATVFTSADTWPGNGRRNSVSRKQGIAEAKTKGVKPTRRRRIRLSPRTPTTRSLNTRANMLAERFNHISHVPRPAVSAPQLWYQTHLKHDKRPGEANQPQTDRSQPVRVERGPDQTLAGADRTTGCTATPSLTSMGLQRRCSLYAYMNQSEQARSHQLAVIFVDHYGLSVGKSRRLDRQNYAREKRALPRAARTKGRRRPRQVMIEGPSHEAIEAHRDSVRDERLGDRTRRQLS